MTLEFSFKTRKDDIVVASGGEFEVLIVGGGISGAGIANILAENGIRTVLVEKSDFASGTSSGSSKLVHGGLRYLANGEFREVKDLLKERDYLVNNTQIVKELNFHILVDEFSWKKSTIRFGLFLYNLLSGKLSIPRYRKNDGRYPSQVRGYFEYKDAYTDDSKLVIYNIVSAKRAGALCLNYVQATGFSKVGDKTTVNLKDTVSGSEFKINAKVVVNACGPWARDLMEMAGVGDEVSLKLSKGIHLVVPSGVAPVKDAIAFRTPLDGRQMFVIPRGEVVHIGTTDTFVSGPDDFRIVDEDVDYLIKSASYLFPGITKEDIITSFSGLRPLFGKGDDPGKISREFQVVAKDNLVNVLGGKITNYRSAARKVAGAISPLLGRKIMTEGLPTINYSPADSERDINYMIMNECPVTFEDIMRRRGAYRVYSLDAGKSKEGKVIKAMEEAGMAVD